MYYDYCFYFHNLMPKDGNMVSYANYIFRQIIDKCKCLTCPWGKKRYFLHLHSSRQIEVAMKNAFCSLEVFRLQLRKCYQNWIRTELTNYTNYRSQKDWGCCQRTLRVFYSEIVKCGFLKFSYFSHFSLVLAISSWLKWKFQVKIAKTFTYFLSPKL